LESDWNEKVSSFFLEYVKPRKEAYTPEGNLTFTTIQASARLLLEQNVFDSKEDMCAQAMKDYKVVLPETIFREE
jgi:hypothetical protein